MFLRLGLALLSLTFASSWTLAQPQPEHKDGKPVVPQPPPPSATPVPKDGKLTIPLTLHPTAAPKPLSKYYFSPQYSEMEPGNRVPGYMKAFMETANFFSKDPSAEREQWNDTRIADLPLDKIKKSGCIGGVAYRTEPRVKIVDGKFDFPSTGRPLTDVDEASRYLSTDWQIWSQLRRDGIATLLPDIQKMRELANVLRVRMRYEIATGDFEKAAYTARTYFGLVQSFENHPTLIGALVGIAIETICLNNLEEMLQQPGCPNLYWSFTEIPAQVMNLRLAFQAEKLMTQSLFRKLLHAKAPLSEDELNETLAEISLFIVLTEEGKKERTNVIKHYTELAKNEEKVASARKKLIDSGMKPELVKSFPAIHVLIAAEAIQYEIDLDEYFLIASLPYPEAKKLAAKMEARFQSKTDEILSYSVHPAVGKVLISQVRAQQRIAYLRVIEAIRLHAFENGGKLPATLKEIKLPLPLDPVTGEAFVYSMKDNVATLTGANPQPGVALTNRVYEIRIKK